MLKDSTRTHLLKNIRRLLEEVQECLAGCACRQPVSDQGTHAPVTQIHYLLQHEGQVDAGHRKWVLPV